jgi:hypothetical protein
MDVGVREGGTSVKVEKLVGEGAGSSIVGSSVVCIPQADSNSERVKNR